LRKKFGNQGSGRISGRSSELAGNLPGGYAEKSVGRSNSWLFAVLACALALPVVSPAFAAPKPKAQAAKPAGKKDKKAKKAKSAEADKKEADGETENEAGESEASSDRRPDAAREEKVKAAGSSAGGKDVKADVKEVKEEQEGVKSYKFNTIEIEGRLKSPQIIYFLRRVRAEFAAGELGHRSFMRELSDTRRSSSFR
jgi:hypothetical protein